MMPSSVPLGPSRDFRPPVPDPPVTGNLVGHVGGMTLPNSVNFDGTRLTGAPLGEHKDAGKTRLDLVDARWIEATGKVLGFGAEKYDPWNWTRGIVYTKLIGSALRHIFAFCRREDLDPESGLPHLAHASCCLMMLYGMTVRHPELDDRVEGV